MVVGPPDICPCIGILRGENLQNYVRNKINHNSERLVKKASNCPCLCILLNSCCMHESFVVQHSLETLDIRKKMFWLALLCCD